MRKKGRKKGKHKFVCSLPSNFDKNLTKTRQKNLTRNSKIKFGRQLTQLPYLNPAQHISNFSYISVIQEQITIKNQMISPFETLAGS
jgi:hypothetical protein